MTGEPKADAGGVAYYNENDPKAAAWLRELITAGHIAPGDVDERSIADVKPTELYGYTQCHFFAGIGGWSLALRLAGWPDSRPVWTGSCPCQPFSVAGKQRGRMDKRHLFPVFCRLVAEARCGEGRSRVPIVFGEQVASKDGREWYAGVRASLEGMGYRVGCADLCAAGVGAPHIRQRLYWMANAERRELRAGRRRHCDEAGSQLENRTHANGCGSECDRTDAAQPGTTNGTRRLADMPANGRQQECADGCRSDEGSGAKGRTAGLGLRSTSGRMVLADSAGWEPRRTAIEAAGHGDSAEPAGRTCRLEHSDFRRCEDADAERKAILHRGGGAWSDFDLLPCIDRKKRRVEPGTFPLAHGVSGRVGLLRGYGNAIVPQVAAEFIQACCEAIAEVALSPLTVCGQKVTQ